MTRPERPQDRHPEVVPTLSAMDTYADYMHAQSDVELRRIASLAALLPVEPLFKAEPEPKNQAEALSPSERFTLATRNRAITELSLGERGVAFFFNEVDKLGFSSRQQLILPCIVAGFTSSEASDHLRSQDTGLTKAVIDNNLKPIREKVGAENKHQIGSHIMKLSDEPPIEVTQPDMAAEYNAEYELAMALERSGMDQLERDVVNLAVRGWEPKQIAPKLSIDYGLAKRYLRDDHGTLHIRRSRLLAHLLEFDRLLPTFTQSLPNQKASDL